MRLRRRCWHSFQRGDDHGSRQCDLAQTLKQVVSGFQRGPRFMFPGGVTPSASTRLAVCPTRRRKDTSEHVEKLPATGKVGGAGELASGRSGVGRCSPDTVNSILRRASIATQHGPGRGTRQFKRTHRRQCHESLPIGLFAPVGSERLKQFP
jgi:hypothetical protein